MKSQKMVLLRCPRCDKYMTVGINDLRVADTVFCPHCYRESEKDKVLNKKKSATIVEKFLYDINDGTLEIGRDNVNQIIEKISKNHHMAPAMVAYVLNAFLNDYTQIDYPPLFAKYVLPSTDLSQYILQLKDYIESSRQSEPQISIMAHCPDTIESSLQQQINELQDVEHRLLEQLDIAHRLAERLQQQIQDKQKEINRLNDEILFHKEKT